MYHDRAVMPNIYLSGGQGTYRYNASRQEPHDEPEEDRP